MKIPYLLGTLILMHCMLHVALECCRRGVDVRFEIVRGSKKCIDFGANTLHGVGSACYPREYCFVEVCGYGRRSAVGYICGNGPCNMWGCNCDGGCIPGNGRENFVILNPETRLLPERC